MFGYANAWTLPYKVVEVFGEEMYFTERRVNIETVPDLMHWYEISGKDIPKEISNRRVSSFYGTLLSFPDIAFSVKPSDKEGLPFKAPTSATWYLNEDEFVYTGRSTKLSVEFARRGLNRWSDYEQF